MVISLLKNKDAYRNSLLKEKYRGGDFFCKMHLDLDRRIGLARA